MQILFGYLNSVITRSIPAPLVGNTLSRQLLEDKQQQLVVVFAVRQVASERLRRRTSPIQKYQPIEYYFMLNFLACGDMAYLAHAAHDAELLRVDEAFEHDADCHVDVVLHHVVTQVHLGVRLRHADHRLDVAHRDGDAARRLRETPRV